MARRDVAARARPEVEAGVESFSGRRASTRCRRSRFAFTSGHSSSSTLYQAESRRSPPRTSMCLRWTPSNCAGSAASAARDRSFSASVLNSTRSAPSVSNACRSWRYFASVFAPVPQASGCEPRPADLERARLRPDRQEPRRAEGAPARSGDRRERHHRRRHRSASAKNAENSSRVCGCTIESQRQVRGSREASQSPSSCSGAQRLEHDDPPLQPLRDPLDTRRGDATRATRLRRVRARA